MDIWILQRMGKVLAIWYLTPGAPFWGFLRISIDDISSIASPHENGSWLGKQLVLSQYWLYIAHSWCIEWHGLLIECCCCSIIMPFRQRSKPSINSTQSCCSNIQSFGEMLLRGSAMPRPVTANAASPWRMTDTVALALKSWQAFSWVDKNYSQAA